MYVITIDRLKVYAYHGVFEQEKKDGQLFFVSAKLYLDVRKAARNDDLSKTTDALVFSDVPGTGDDDGAFSVTECAAIGDTL